MPATHNVGSGGTNGGDVSASGPVVSDGLRGLSWGGLDWARQTWDEAVKKGDLRPWRTRHQRRLWGLTTTR